MLDLQFHTTDVPAISRALERFRVHHRQPGVTEQLVTTVCVLHPVEDYLGQLDAYIASLRTPGRKALQGDYSKLLRGLYVHKRKGRARRRHPTKGTMSMWERFELIDGKTQDGGPVAIPTNARLFLVNKWVEIPPATSSSTSEG